jgi:glycosyltransferase involved in cell wall biosynthesis
MNNQFPNNIISIILPVRNEALYIRSCIEQLYAQQNVPFPLEIIVADGMSTDGTREIIREMQSKYSNLILIDNPQKIVPTGMNLALQIAKGKFIIRIDGHCLINSAYVKLHKAFACGRC